MSSPIPEEKLAALRTLIFEGKKIQAIKVYRETTGLGLKESKEAVEELESLLRKDSPEMFPRSSQAKGCFGAAAVLCLFLSVLGYWAIRN